MICMVIEARHPYIRLISKIGAIYLMPVNSEPPEPLSIVDLLTSISFSTQLQDVFVHFPFLARKKAQIAIF